MKIFILVLLLSIPAVSFSQNTALKIFFLGDLNFGESYQSDPKFNRGINIINKFGYDYMFADIKTVLAESDFTVANLETPLTDSSSPKISLRKMYIHWSRPQQTIEYLKKYKIGAVSLGNNHAFDCTAVGLNNTISSLLNGGIEFFGAGDNDEQASKPLVKQFVKNGDTVTIAVFTGFEYRKTYDSLFKFYAGVKKEGVNQFSVEKITAQIREIKNNYRNPYIIIFPHWGKNYQWKNDKQTEDAYKLIDAGADIIIGTGPHMIQEAEKYSGHWIIYSIGNSVFNAPGRYDTPRANPYSFIAGLIFRNVPGDEELHLRLYPLYTDNLKDEYQTRFLNDNEIEDCYNLLKSKSSDKKMFEEEFRLKSLDNLKFFEIQLK